MRKAIIKFRGFPITRRELVADLIFLIFSFLVSLLALYIFDIHWSFYPGNTLIPPSKHVGISYQVFLIGSLIGAIAGFFLIKVFLLGVKVEEQIWKKTKTR
jgi:hypothetical protein